MAISDVILSYCVSNTLASIVKPGHLTTWGFFRALLLEPETSCTFTFEID